MSGTLLCDYQLAARKELGLMPKNPAVIKTIVTTNMCDVVAKKFGCTLIQCLTGFKYIGEQIKLFEQGVKDYSYVFGYEESYGCLIGTHARDKDACAAVMGLCEAAAYNKLQGKSLWDRMLEMYEEYGYYREGAVSVTMKGADGAQKIAAILDNLRQNPISELGGFKVLEARDYKLHTVKNLVTGEEGKTDLPESNVLYYVLENDQWCCVRPSGTEPKIKFYYGIKGSSMAEADELFDKVGEAIKKLA
jgi:phosphoglucomutase